MQSLPQLAKPIRIAISIGLLFSTWMLTYGPLAGSKQTIVVVSGTELQEPLEELEPIFEQTYPNIQLQLEFQGSQDIVNNYLNDQNDFEPTVLIPASAEFLTELEQTWRSTTEREAFHEAPKAIVSTMLVAISWAERGNIIFPSDRFRWDRLETVLRNPTQSWEVVGGPADWGRFNLMMTDPGRSNSGQLTLGLWARSKLNTDLTSAGLQRPDIIDLVDLVQRSVYQPPRSTDILLQEFITRGPNDADVATVYESIALNRWFQANNQGKPYQIYYPNPTMETTATAAIVRRNVSDGQVKAARKFVDFLRDSAQQEVFVQYGFRPMIAGLDLTAVEASPWAVNVPGALLDPGVEVVAQPDRAIVNEIIRLWSKRQIR